MLRMNPACATTSWVTYLVWPSLKDRFVDIKRLFFRAWLVDNLVWSTNTLFNNRSTTAVAMQPNYCCLECCLTCRWYGQLALLLISSCTCFTTLVTAALLESRCNLRTKVCPVPKPGAPKRSSTVLRQGRCCVVFTFACDQLGKFYIGCGSEAGAPL